MNQMITNEEKTQLQELLENCTNVVIVAHKAPDGDAVGSSLAMYEYFKVKGKTATVIMPDAFPDFLAWMNDSDKIVLYDKEALKAEKIIRQADLICCLDFNELSRIDALASPVDKAQCKKLHIDHHINPENFADLIISRPDASSTCDLVYRILDSIGGTKDLPISAAEDIYAGICTDTGAFTYNSNNPEVFRIVGDLIEKGIDRDLIYRRLYNNYSVSHYRLLGYILSEKLKVYPEFHAAVYSLTKDELHKFNYVKGDTEGVVNIPLTIKGMKLSISLREDTVSPVIRVSIRSYDDFPANEMAGKFFNGGGHFHAAGGRLTDMSMDEAILYTEKAIASYADLLE